MYYHDFHCFVRAGMSLIKRPLSPFLSSERMVSRLDLANSLSRQASGEEGLHSRV
jgi:hypothetical protein